MRVAVVMTVAVVVLFLAYFLDNRGRRRRQDHRVPGE